MKTVLAFLAVALGGCATYTLQPHQVGAAVVPQAQTVTCLLPGQPVWTGAQWVCAYPQTLPYPYYGYAPYRYGPNWGIYLHFGRRHR